MPWHSFPGCRCRRERGSGADPSPFFSQVQIYNPAFFKYIHDRWTEHHGRYPSTGMLVLFFALHVCDEVGDGSSGSSSGVRGSRLAQGSQTWQG